MDDLDMNASIQSDFGVRGRVVDVDLGLSPTSCRTHLVLENHAAAHSWQAIHLLYFVYPHLLFQINLPSFRKFRTLLKR